MDFDFRKPRHLLAFILLSISFLLVIVSAIISYFMPFPTSSSIGTYTGITQLILEIYLLTFSLLFVVLLMIIIPMMWYILVNRLRLREILHRLLLHRQGLSQALLWGFIAAITALIVSVAIDLLIMQFGVDTTKLSNIPQLLQLFPIPALFVLITVQPIAEEIFFRGFLLEKLSWLAGPYVGVLISSVLFGLAHLSYGMLYTAVMATGLGIVFGIVVVRTKNLYSSIVAHILVNVTSMTLFLLGKSIGT
jgi:hypothetical protein